MNIDDEPRATILMALGKRSSGRGLFAIFAQISAIVAAVAVGQTIREPWAIGVAIVFIGTRQYGLGEVLVHEASHGNLCRRRKLNDALGTFLSWPFFYTFEGYRRFHLQHHRLPLDDPENSIFEEYRDWRLPLSDERVSGLRMFWLVVLRPLTGVIALYHLWGVASDAYYDSDLRENTYMWLWWGFIAAVLYWFNLMGVLLLYWLAPLFLVFASLNYWSEVGDHYRTSSVMTRSYVAIWWNRLIAGNIGYHIVHHRYPGIPWFSLKAAHDQLGRRLQGQTSATLFQAFRQICGSRQRIGTARNTNVSSLT